VPGVGEDHLSTEPVEQPAADPVWLAFQPDDLFAEGRLGDALPLCGPGEAPGLGHRHEIPELVKFHRRDQSKSGLGLFPWPIVSVPPRIGDRVL
jgi:hypothetical protein